jgi:hypothetical protein
VAPIFLNNPIFFLFIFRFIFLVQIYSSFFAFISGFLLGCQHCFWIHFTKNLTI